jgi:hypothetical protein
VKFSKEADLTNSLSDGVYKSTTVKPVLNGISRDQKIFPLKPGFRLIKVYYNNLIRT